MNTTKRLKAMTNEEAKYQENIERLKALDLKFSYEMINHPEVTVDISHISGEGIMYAQTDVHFLNEWLDRNIDEAVNIYKSSEFYKNTRIYSDVIAIEKSIYDTLSSEDKKDLHDNMSKSSVADKCLSVSKKSFVHKMKVEDGKVSRSCFEEATPLNEELINFWDKEMKAHSERKRSFFEETRRLSPDSFRKDSLNKDNGKRYTHIFIDECSDFNLEMANGVKLNIPKDNPLGLYGSSTINELSYYCDSTIPKPNEQFGAFDIDTFLDKLNLPDNTITEDYCLTLHSSKKELLESLNHVVSSDSKSPRRYRGFLLVFKDDMPKEFIFITFISDEIERLRDLQANRGRWFTQQEFETLQYLLKNRD
ncbi:hypothetical protein ACFFVB_18450 [Formosa undariae]|uniref:Uncharacterized protein n=1 Tax=Formosa undariae TaxID=1325436 RepID=A0ABV5F6J7_9FLAO